MRKEAFRFETLLFVCILAAILITALVSFLSITKVPDINRSVNTASVVRYEEGWVAEKGFTTKLNNFSVNSSVLSVDKPMIFTKKIDDLSGKNVLFINTRNIVLNIYIDGEPIHITADSGNIAELDGFENYIIANIPESAAGKEIKLEVFKTKYSLSSRINKMLLGPGSTIMKDLMLEGVFPLFVGELVFIIGVGFVLLGIFVRKKLDSYLSSLFFGIFLIFISFCIMMDTAWGHIVINDPVYLENSLCACHLASIPAFLAFVDVTLDTEHFYPLKVLTVGVTFAMTVLFILDMINVVSIIALGYVVHILLVVCSAVVCVELIMFLVRIKGTRPSQGRAIYIAVFVLSVCGLIDIMIYYTNPYNGNEMFMTCLGVLVITAITLRTRFIEILEMIKLGIQAGRIGKIAFTDANTGIGNAAAFKAKFDDLESNRFSHRYIAIIQFDVNNLKVINDSKGHEAGDLLIKTAANIINGSFGIVGNCYRTGGDEFVAIVCSEHAPIVCEEAIYKFNKLIDKFNADPNKPFELRIAHGVAYYQNDQDENISLKEVHKMADERMYTNKKMLKARYARTAEEAVIR